MNDRSRSKRSLEFGFEQPVTKRALQTYDAPVLALASIRTQGYGCSCAACNEIHLRSSQAIRHSIPSLPDGKTAAYDQASAPNHIRARPFAYRTPQDGAVNQRLAREV